MKEKKEKLFNARAPIQLSLYCVGYAHGKEQRACFIYRGDSLCQECYDKIKQWEKQNKIKTMGFKL